MRASVHIAEAESRKKSATEALIRGLKGLGISVTVRDYDDAPSVGADFAVTWGHKHRCCTIARACVVPMLVVERPYFGNRATNYSLTWNWAHRLGVRPEAGSTHRPQPALSPWTERDTGSIVVFDQVPTDIMFREVAGTKWAERIADAAGRFWHRHAYVRPHPNVRRTDTIQQALQSAWMGIAFTSTAAVDCAIGGVPIVTVDPRNMAWDVASHSDQMRQRHDREEWAHWLSWCQWNGEELEDGTALKHVLTAHDEAKETVEEIKRTSGLDGDS